MNKIKVNPQIFGKNMAAWYADAEKARKINDVEKKVRSENVDGAVLDREMTRDEILKHLDTMHSLQYQFAKERQAEKVPLSSYDHAIEA